MPSMTATQTPVPLVGRHRNTALATWRRTRAVELATAGHSYQSIAQSLGYANRGTVHRIVHQALDRQGRQAIDTHRSTQLDRLEALLQTVWPKALTGHIPSVASALRIIDEESRLLGLPGPQAQGTSGCPRPTTLVIHQDCLTTRCQEHS
jgi:transposase-like protein